MEYKCWSKIKELIRRAKHTQADVCLRDDEKNMDGKCVNLIGLMYVY